MKGSKGGFAVAFVLTALLMGGTVGSAFAQDSPSASPSAGQDAVRFTWGATGEPSSLNPMSGYLATDFYFWTATYHLLINFGQNLEAENSLATHVETSPDSMTFTYTIRDDIKWSDGQPLTADDVAYTLNLYKQNHAYLPQGYLQLIDGEVKVLDPTHIQFSTKEPTGLYSGQFTYMYDYILPKHVFEGIDKPKQFENVPNVGSGPFVITDYQVGEFVKMDRNPYWTGPAPAIDELVYRIYKNDDALAQALKQGEVDFAYFSSANVYNSVKNQPNIATAAAVVPSFQEIGMNTGSAYQPASGSFVPHGDGHPALTDVTVRRAIRMAIDSKELANKVLLGYGLPGDSIIPPVSVKGARWQPTGSDVIPWDIAGANKLLDDAGYADTDGDGVREMPPGSLDPGRPLEFRYYVRTNEQSSVDAAPFVSEWLSQIGIKTDLQAMTSGRLGDIINAGTYDLYSWGWLPDPDPDSMLANMTCDQRPPDGSTYGNNDAYYCNPEYDKLLGEQRAQTDPKKRWEIVHEMQRIFYEDAAYAVMWYDPLFQGYRTDRFTGYQAQPQPNGDLLEGYGGPSSVWWKLQPVGSGTIQTETRGLPAVVWVIAGLVVIAAVALYVLRRRRVSEDEA